MKPAILVIDDDEDMINLFSINLKKDFQVTSELVGSNAIKTAATVKPKVVLLDLHMPNVDGYEVLMQFKNHPGTANLPVICISADTSDTARDRAYALGAIGFIKKPPQLKQLANNIHSFLGSINPRLESFDKKVLFTIAFNEDEKNALIQLALNDFQSKSQKVVVLSWKDGQEFFKNYASVDERIEEESLVFLKIKPALITKFPYMQELEPIINDIRAFAKEDLTNFSVVLDEPSLFFNQHDMSNSTAKVFALKELLSKNFSSIGCFSTKQREPQKEVFLMGLARAFVGTTG